jgi:protein-S-isoprenylcysteine O-methyltransferase Ste14
MRPLVFTDHSDTIVFTIALALWVIPERIGSWWWRSSRDPTARREDRGSMVLVVGSVVAGLLLGFVLASQWRGVAIPWLRTQVTIAGIVLIVLGTMLRWWSILTLGRYFTLDVAVRSTQRVVQSGPYRFVRHPSYTGLLLIFVGVGLTLANWGSIISILVVCPLGLLYRVRVEERALAASLGQPYVDYMRHTKRFIPFVV